MPFQSRHCGFFIIFSLAIIFSLIDCVVSGKINQSVLGVGDWVSGFGQMKGMVGSSRIDEAISGLQGD